MTELLDLADRVLALAQDGEQLEVVAVKGTDTEIRVYEGDIESLTSSESQGVGIRVIADQRQGFAYCGSLDFDVLTETLTEARDNASFGTEDEFLGLAEPDGVKPVELDLFRDVNAVETTAKIDLALELEKAAKARDPRISIVESADYYDGFGESAFATTAGIRSTTKESTAYVSVSVIANEGDDTQDGFGYAIGRELSELDIDKAAADAAKRATQLLGAKQAPSERLTVVLDPYVAAQFTGIIAGTLSGERVLKGRSPFADRLGEMVADTKITLVDDPTDPRALTASATDGEGLATRRNLLIDAGELKSFVHNSYTARRAGTASTGSAVRGGFKSTPGVGTRAVSIQPGEISREDLIAGIDNGLLVTSVSGLHSGVNPTSGDFSTGASGLRIRNGELAEPIREVTIASTLQRMMLDVMAIADDTEWLPMSATGVTMSIADVTMSGS